MSIMLTRQNVKAHKPENTCSNSPSDPSNRSSTTLASTGVSCVPISPPDPPASHTSSWPPHPMGVRRLGFPRRLNALRLVEIWVLIYEPFSTQGDVYSRDSQLKMSLQPSQLTLKVPQASKSFELPLSISLTKVGLYIRVISIFILHLLRSLTGTGHKPSSPVG